MNNNNNSYDNNVHHDVKNGNSRNYSSKDEPTTCNNPQCCCQLIGKGSQGCGGNAKREIMLCEYLQSQMNAPARPKKSRVETENTNSIKHCSSLSSICDFLRSGAKPEGTKQTGQQKQQANDDNDDTKRGCKDETSTCNNPQCCCRLIGTASQGCGGNAKREIMLCEYLQSQMNAPARPKKSTVAADENTNSTNRCSSLSSICDFLRSGAKPEWTKETGQQKQQENDDDDTKRGCKDETTTCDNPQCCCRLIGTGSQGCGGNAKRDIMLCEYLQSQMNAPARPKKSRVETGNTNSIKNCSSLSSICDFLRSGTKPEGTKQTGQQKQQANDGNDDTKRGCKDETSTCNNSQCCCRLIGTGSQGCGGNAKRDIMLCEYLQSQMNAPARPKKPKVETGNTNSIKHCSSLSSICDFLRSGTKPEGTKQTGQQKQQANDGNDDTKRGCKDETSTCNNSQCCCRLIGTGSQGCGGNAKRDIMLCEYLQSQMNAPTRPKKSRVETGNTNSIKNCSSLSSICDFLRSGTKPEGTKQTGQQKQQANDDNDDTKRGCKDETSTCNNSQCCCRLIGTGSQGCGGNAKRDIMLCEYLQSQMNVPARPKKSTVAADENANSINRCSSLSSICDFLRSGAKPEWTKETGQQKQQVDAKDAEDRWIKMITKVIVAAAEDVCTITRTADQQSRDHVTIVIDGWNSMKVTRTFIKTDGTDPSGSTVLHKKTSKGRRRSPCAENHRVKSRGGLTENAHSQETLSATDRSRSDRYRGETRTKKPLQPSRSSCERLRVTSRGPADERVAHASSSHRSRTPLPLTDDDTSVATEDCRSRDRDSAPSQFTGRRDVFRRSGWDGRQSAGKCDYGTSRSANRKRDGFSPTESVLDVIRICERDWSYPATTSCACRCHVE